MPEHRIGTRAQWQVARDELAKLETEQAERNEEITKIRDIDLLCSGFLREGEPAVVAGDESVVMGAVDLVHLANQR